MRRSPAGNEALAGRSTEQQPPTNPYQPFEEDLVRNKRALRIISGLGGVAAILAITPSSVFAQDGPTTQDYLNNIWVFIAGVLVFFMQAGFALVEAGLTRAKNVVNIFAKNMADAIVGITAWFACGYAFAFGGGGKWIGDSAVLPGRPGSGRHPARAD